MLWGKECTVHIGACFSGGSREAPAAKIQISDVLSKYSIEESQHTTTVCTPVPAPRGTTFSKVETDNAACDQGGNYHSFRSGLG